MYTHFIITLCMEMSKQSDKHSKRRRSYKPTSLKTPDGVSVEALCLDLLTDGVTAQQLPGCPVSLRDVGQEQPQPGLQEADAEGLQQLQIQMDTWSQLPQVLLWFSGTVLRLDPKAKLSFASCLPKELRADVHNLVSKKHHKSCQSVSEGFGDDRYVGVVAKGTRAPASRRMTSEQADHAVALWLLWKQQQKQQQKQTQVQKPKQQQQQEQEQRDGAEAGGNTLSSQHDHQQLQVSQLHHHHHQQQQQLVYQQQEPAPEAQAQQMAPGAAGDVESILSSAVDLLDLGFETGGSRGATSVDGLGHSSSADDAGGAVGQGARVYSRDEVGQMLVQDKLTDELAALWQGPAGVSQRAVRLLCLAAAAGDLEEVQVLASAHPQLLVEGVQDLSSGGAMPLQLAAAGGHCDVLRALLAAGAPLEATDGKHETALQVAQRCEQCDCEAILIQAGAVNTQQDSWEEFAKGGVL